MPDDLHLPGDQLDLLEEDAPWDGPEEAPPATAEAAPEWHELEIEGRKYRWRLDTEAIDREWWSPGDRVPIRGESDELQWPFKPPGPAFEVEFESVVDGRWRAVRYLDRIVEVWGMVRDEAMDETEDG